MTEYYVSVDGNQTGPHTYEEVKAMTFSEDNLIWNENLPAWFNANDYIRSRKPGPVSPPDLPDKKFDELTALKQALIDCSLPFAIMLILAFLYFNGFASNYELEQMYPVWGNLDGSEIRNITTLMSIIAALIPALIILIARYRIRIIREAKRLKMTTADPKRILRVIHKDMYRLRDKHHVSEHIF